MQSSQIFFSLHCQILKHGTISILDSPPMMLFVASLYRICCCFLESLELLISSLDQAPFDVQNIPTLFYLVESVLYTVRTDTSRQPYLVKSEMQLLTMGRLVLQRLYFHYMAQQLATFDGLTRDLIDYLDGLWGLRYNKIFTDGKF